GFFLFALSSIVTLVNIGGAIFDAGLRLEFELFLNRVSLLLALMGWWFFTRIQVCDPLQSRALCRGFLAFALQFAVQASGEMLRANGLFPINRHNSAFWLTLAGDVVAIVGYLMASGVARSSGASSSTSVVSKYASVPSSRLICVGYAIIAISFMSVLFYDGVNPLFLAGGVRNDLRTFTQPVAGLLTAVGWWFLGRLDVRGDEQRKINPQAFWA